MRTQGKWLTTRISEHAHEQLKTAANLLGVTINQFVGQAALDKADHVLGNTLFELTRRESLRLLELIENPPPRNEKFLRAGRKPSTIYAKYHLRKRENDHKAIYGFGYLC